jgi:antitoxin component YwqK of YwqJK toxin-antitoxin module
LFFSNSAQRSYTKTYFKNGQLQAEGWLIINQKVDYWFYYYENGNKKEEGHYEDNKM